MNIGSAGRATDNVTQKVYMLKVNSNPCAFHVFPLCRAHMTWNCFPDLLWSRFEGGLLCPVLEHCLLCPVLILAMILL